MKSKRGSSATASAKGKTDWARVRTMKDADIQFTADAPRTSAEDWADAVAASRSAVTRAKGAARTGCGERREPHRSRKVPG